MAAIQPGYRLAMGRCTAYFDHTVKTGENEGPGVAQEAELSRIATLLKIYRPR